MPFGLLVLIKISLGQPAGSKNVNNSTEQISKTSNHNRTNAFGTARSLYNRVNSQVIY